MTEDSPQKKGGDARAAKLTADERSGIARNAANARIRQRDFQGDGADLVKATHQGKMTVGALDLDCYVLEDGRRVFHKRGMARALGMKSGGGNVFLRAVQRKGLGSEIKDNLLI